MRLNEFIKTQLFTKDQETFFRAYIRAVYFTETGDVGQPSSDSEMTLESLKWCADDCCKFFNVYSDLFNGHIEQAGHDFWLTRNGLGAGFRDHSEMYGDHSEELTRACELFGEVYPEFEE